MTDSPAATPQKSTFVSILAWVFIVLSAGATAVSVLQSLLLYLLFPRAEMKAALANGLQSQAIPWGARVMVSHFEVFIWAFLVISVVMLVTAIGLLRRWNWARRIFILLMAMGIVWNLAGVLLQYWLFADVPVPLDNPGEFSGAMQAMMLAMRIFTALVAVVMSGVMGWVMWRLTRPAIAAEFGVGKAVAPLPVPPAEDGKH